MNRSTRWDLTTLEHASHWSVHLYAAMGFYALTLGGDFPAPLVLLAVLGWCASAFAPRHTPLRRNRLWGNLLLAHLAVQALRFVSGEPGLGLALEFAASLQWVRLWTRRVPKDDAQIALLAFLHLIAGTVLTTSLTFGAVFVVFVLCTPLILFINHLSRTVGRLPAGQRQRIHARSGFLTQRFVWSLALLAIPTFVMTTALFLIFPRVGLGLAAIKSERGQSTTGFSDNVTLGGFGTIRQDATIVMRIKRDDRRSALRMRGTSFDFYDGRTWSQPFDPRRRLPWTGNRVWVRTPARDAGWHTMDVMLEPLDQPVLFAPRDAIALQMERRPDITVAESSGTYRYPITSLDGLRYTVVRAQAEPLAEDHPAQPRGRHLRIPGGHERVAKLAERVVGDAQHDAQKAERLLLFLRSSGEYRYSLDLPNVARRVPLEVFLFEAKAGHCEYFSTSLAIMLRAVGVPSRNVTGFVGGAVNPYGNYEVLRQADAHSWVEAFYDGRWQTLDPTPPAHTSLKPKENWLSNFNAMLDAMRQRWGDYVVGYDRDKQYSVLRRLARWWRRGGDRGTDGDPTHAANKPPGLSSNWAWGVGIIAVIAFVAFRWRRRDRREPSVLDALDRRWERLGHARPPGRTQLAHAQQLCHEGIEEPAFIELVHAALAERFGASQDPHRAAQLRERIAKAPRAVPQGDPVIDE